MTTEIKQDQYRCAQCQGIFDEGWSEEEAQAEADSNGFNVYSCVTVCEDCYQAMMKRHS